MEAPLTQLSQEQHNQYIAKRGKDMAKKVSLFFSERFMEQSCPKGVMTPDTFKAMEHLRKFKDSVPTTKPK
jgi:hypothetical protein